MNRCPSGKRTYDTEPLAEEALIQAYIQFDYRAGTGPVAVYRCEDCGRYHLTSTGTMNARLSGLLADGTIQKQKQARQWEQKWKK